MSTAFRAFMNRIIDYAGLFPPAKLSMDDAIQNYLKYKNDSDEWMLSRFICPAIRLKELEKYQDKFRSFEKPLSFSFLGRGGKSINEFLTGLIEDLNMVMEFRRYNADNIKVDAYEVRLPGEIIGKPDPESIANFLNRVAEVVESGAPDNLSPFYEGAFTGEWEDMISALISGISQHNQFVEDKGFAKYKTAGYKLRCGGVEPSMYPAPEQIAHVILTCKRYRIPLKATAGLHHPLRGRRPIRHFNEAEQLKMYGFLNVFGAGILAQYHDMGVSEIKKTVEDENPDNFTFSDNEFKWCDISVNAKQIQQAREERIISFGSCSFDEPREDLQELGYLIE